MLKSFCVPLTTRDESDYVIISEHEHDKEVDYVPEGPKNALHHLLQVRGKATFVPYPFLKLPQSSIVIAAIIPSERGRANA